VKELSKSIHILPNLLLQCNVLNHMNRCWHTRTVKGRVESIPNGIVTVCTLRYSDADDRVHELMTLSYMALYHTSTNNLLRC